MASQMMLLNELIPKDALSLGSLVESIQNPIVDAYINRTTLPPDAVLPIPAKGFEALSTASKSNSFNVALTKLFGIGHDNAASAEASLKSIQVTRYMLKQPKQLFKELCSKNEEARGWLNDGIQAGSKSYLVVEVQTARDAILSHRDTASSSSDLKATVPTSTIATGGADILGLGQALDVEAKAGHKVSSATAKSFSLEGEAIFAVGYKKVLWKSWPLQKKELDKAVLDKEITWTVLGGKRSREGGGEVISVDLTDDLDAKPEADGDDEDELDALEDDGDDDIAELIKDGVEVGGQMYIAPKGN
ncbi:hypothetical protein BDV96DRAFT_593540 [Lophiotrema nucula]|uniref:Uncharacterized protein n=1 Tax=Lophiotrema nucula TaxID=690887 RepID=A0A6A5ZUX1_9PLEO|nr:hypothetical protein BDV96DRAFT_593540 [Lophiotrema nucula]